MTQHLDRLANAVQQVMKEYYQHCREAERCRDEELHAATVLQTLWRGWLQRHEVDKLRSAAVAVQKCWRGYLGRKRFAAVLAAHNTLLRQAYFHHHATVIQKWWRGHFNRAHIHDFYKRKAFLQSVAAANAVVKAAMEADMQAALTCQQQQAQAQAKQHFDAQVGKLHYLSSTASIPGIFGRSQHAATDPGHAQAAFTISGQPLEDHIRTAAKHKAAAAVRHQQVVLKQTLSNTQLSRSIFPAGMPQQLAGLAGAHGGSGGMAMQLPAQKSASIHAVAAPSGAAVSAQGSFDGNKVPARLLPQGQISSGGDGAPEDATLCSLSNGSGYSMDKPRANKGSPNTVARSKMQLPQQKLAQRVIETCVEEVYAALAEPNMPDGSFNPGLSLQQSTNYEAAREAANLERRLDRGLMLAQHSGRPFSPIVGKVQPTWTYMNEHSGDEPLNCHDRGREEDTTAVVVSRDGGPNNAQLWKHNKFSGGMFSKHLKQVY